MVLCAPRGAPVTSRGRTRGRPAIARGDSGSASGACMRAVGASGACLLAPLLPHLSALADQKVVQRRDERLDDGHVCARWTSGGACVLNRAPCAAADGERRGGSAGACPKARTLKLGPLFGTLASQYAAQNMVRLLSVTGSSLPK